MSGFYNVVNKFLSFKGKVFKKSEVRKWRKTILNHYETSTTNDFYRRNLKF